MTSIVDHVFNSVLGFYLPLIEELRDDRAEHAIFEAALNSVGQIVGQELLRLRVRDFVAFMSRDAAAVALKEPTHKIEELTKLHCRIHNWGRRNIVEADRATQIGVAILIGGTNILDQGELYDLPDELADLLPAGKQADRRELRRRYSASILRHHDLLAPVALLAKRLAAE